jgi:hypothetical protein
MPRGAKRILACGDLHAGHFAGWCPRRRWSSIPDVRTLQRETNTWLVDRIHDLQPIDTLLINGDAIDGKGSRSGGRELYEPDRIEQARLAWEFVELVRPRVLVQTYGTPYHVGDQECFESIVADRAAASRVSYRVGDYIQFSLGGVSFGCRHHIGGSQIPHGRYTALARTMLWQRLWADAGRRDRVDVVLRSHVHYFAYAGSADMLGMILPALQAARTEYGARQCDGTVDFGFATFDVDGGGGFTWQRHILRPEAERVTTVALDHIRPNKPR